jgi:hypothetical protein
MFSEFLEIAKLGDEHEVKGILANLSEEPLNFMVIECRKDRTVVKAKAYYMGVELGLFTFKKVQGKWEVAK